MGTSNSKPTTKTGKNVVRQKVENATKTGILSLRDHKLEAVPENVFSLTNLRTLDLSGNKLKRLSPKLSALSNIKSLNCDKNIFPAGSLDVVSKLPKLQTLSAGGNKLGQPVKMESPSPQPQPLPTLPATMKHLKLDSNFFSSVPRQILSSKLVKLEKLDLSGNNLATIPAEIANLISLTELNLDRNSIVSLPNEVGQLKKLKSLSLQYNHIQVHSTSFSERNPQPLPAALFTSTPITDLNLRGNKMTNTQLNEFEGFPDFLERRQGVKTKNLYGGAMADLSVCGLD